MPPKKRATRTADCCVAGCEECARWVTRTFTMRVPTHCNEHAQPRTDFFEYSGRLCKVETCSKRASFAKEYGMDPEYCRDHKLAGQVNSKKALCSTCKRVKPIFAPPGTKKRLRCTKCKEPGDVDIQNRFCKLCDENQVRTYVPGENTKVASICMTCAQKNGYDVPNLGETLCIVCESVQSCFGLPGGEAQYCGSCRDPDRHVDVKHDGSLCQICYETRGHKHR